MTWFKADDGFYDHPKVVPVSLAARGLWITAGAYCSRHLTNGHVTTRVLWMLAAGDDPAPLIGELVDAGLWEPTDAGYLFHDWGDYQPTRQRVEDARAKNAERQQRWRERHKGSRNGVTDDVTDSVSNPRPGPARPDPSRGLLAVASLSAFGLDEDDHARFVVWLRKDKGFNRPEAFIEAAGKDADTEGRLHQLIEEYETEQEWSA